MQLTIHIRRSTKTTDLYQSSVLRIQKQNRQTVIIAPLVRAKKHIRCLSFGFRRFVSPVLQSIEELLTPKEGSECTLGRQLYCSCSGSCKQAFLRRLYLRKALKRAIKEDIRINQK